MDSSSGDSLDALGFLKVAFALHCACSSSIDHALLYGMTMIFALRARFGSSSGQFHVPLAAAVLLRVRSKT